MIAQISWLLTVVSFLVLRFRSHLSLLRFRWGCFRNFLGRDFGRRLRLRRLLCLNFSFGLHDFGGLRRFLSFGSFWTLLAALLGLGGLFSGSVCLCHGLEAANSQLLWVRVLCRHKDYELLLEMLEILDWGLRFKSAIDDQVGVSALSCSASEHDSSVGFEAAASTESLFHVAQREAERWLEKDFGSEVKWNSSTICGRH